MKKTTGFLLLVLLLGLPSLVPAAMTNMDQYCSAPPFVTRSIAPNILVLMDNSDDMMEPAHPGDYTPNGSNDNYAGYFVPQQCYEYSQKFIPGTNNADGSCPAAAPFRGNLLNWATTSKYDLLQKVLVGGNTTSKQGNAHTVLAIGGTFPDRAYNDCIFQYNNGNLSITESVSGACGLLNPVAGFALNPFKVFGEMFARGGRLGVEALAAEVAGVGRLLLALWDEIDLVSQAWAANLTLAVKLGSFDGKVGQAYSLTLEAGGDNNTVYKWEYTIDPPAPWLTLQDPLGSTGNKKNYLATWAGTPAAPGTYTLTVTLSDSDNNTGVIRDYIIKVAPGDLRIVTADLSTALRDTYYEFTMTGMGGVPIAADGHGTEPHYHWSATGLPASLFINQGTGKLFGIPASSGTSAVSITVTDSEGVTATVGYSLVVSGASPLTILTSSLTTGVRGQFYLTWLEAAGGTPPYTWSQTGLPAGLYFQTPYYSGSANYGTYINSTPTVSGTFPMNITVQDTAGATASQAYDLVISEPAAGPLAITTPNALPPAELGGVYYLTFAVTGGTPAYNWSQTGMPAGMTFGATGGTRYIQWTPSALGTYTFTVTIVDSLGETISKVFTLEVLRRVSVRKQDFNVKIDLFEETLTLDVNRNGIFDGADQYIEAGGDPNAWDGKKGVFQTFWDANKPKARFGLAMFQDVGLTTKVNLAACIPASPAASFFTNVQNATATDRSPLASQLYSAIQYYNYKKEIPDPNPHTLPDPAGTGFSGCSSSDPIDDNIPCRKNFILMLTSGSNLDEGDVFAKAGDCNQDNPVVRNACIGFATDLRPPDGVQNVKTFVVNTMGTPAAGDTLEKVAAVGGGSYYPASNSSDLQAQLTKALEDILSQAASGTAVSVLTTSSRGIGSMMQAYFLPTKQEGPREVSWTGYVQNIWIDPTDNLREDTGKDLKLNLTQDHVLRLFFDSVTKETKAALFDETALATCTKPAIVPFSEIQYNWEGGKKLALQDPGSRKIFTSTKVIRGAATSHTFAADAPLADPTYPAFKTTMGATLLAALNAEVTDYTADNIVKYVRGECLETGVSGDTPCAATPNGIFRDRRVTISALDGGDVSGNVWKLGDVISSTPKVLANTPNNTYHLDYGDSTYYNFVTAEAYKNRSSIALVGANDGMLHAFRIGYLKDKGIVEPNVLGLFQNKFGDTATDEIGTEVWGYIPFNAFPYLKYLADPGYCHLYYNDLSVRLVDASVGCVASPEVPDPTVCDEPADARVPQSWRSILIGGMRFGGGCEGGTPEVPVPSSGVGYSSYYAIDVTDADKPIPLWEFSDIDMGYATGYPSVLRTGGTGVNGNWYVVFGSGSSVMPKSGLASQDAGRTTTGYLYILDLKSGTLVKKIDLGHNAIVGDVLAIDQDKNYSTETVYFGTSYFDSIWKGKLGRLDIPNQDLAAAWPVGSDVATYLFAGDYPFTASPDATRDGAGNIWVYAGSGKYYSDVDEDTSDTQVFLGIKDLPSGVTYPVGTATAGMDDKTGIITTGNVTGTTMVCSYDPDEPGLFGMKPVVTSTAQTSLAQSPPAIGWYVSLANGERVISRPLAVGGLVDFLTYQPSSDACSYGGNSYLYALDYTTGVAPASIAIRSEDATSGLAGGVDVHSRVLLGPGAPPTGEAIIVPPPKEGQEQLKKKIQVATGVIVEAENTPVFSVISKIVHWFKK